MWDRMYYLKRIFHSILLLFVCSSCNESTRAGGSVIETFGIFNVSATSSKRTLPNDLYKVEITKDTTMYYVVALGSARIGAVDSGKVSRGDNNNFDPYKGTTWKIIDESGKFPSFIKVIINPETLDVSKGFIDMTIKTDGVPTNGAYRLRIEANRADFNNPRSFYLDLIVNIPSPPLPLITPKFQFDTLYVAPGETKTNLMTIEGIKPGQRFRIDHYIAAVDLKIAWVSVTDSVFTVDKNTATWSVAVPATANPNVDGDGINMYPTYLNTNNRIDFEGNRNGFGVFIAGSTVHYIQAGSTVKFGDTATIEVDYIVNGNGAFTPKLVPVTIYPPDVLEITMPYTQQNTNSNYGKRLVKATYKVFFKKMPANKNASFDVGGDITYGKTVSKRLLLTLQ